MANWSDLKAAVASIVKTKGNKEITGQVLQNVLNNNISNVGLNSTFAGIATPGTNPGTPDGNVFYLATTEGTYSNFNGIVINSGEAVILEWKGSWTKKDSGFATQEKLSELGSEVLSIKGGQYDISNKIEIGLINYDGSLISNATCCRTKDYITENISRIETAYPYKVKLFAYNESGLFVGMWNGTNFSLEDASFVEALEVDTIYPYKYKILFQDTTYTQAIISAVVDNSIVKVFGKVDIINEDIIKVKKKIDIVNEKLITEKKIAWELKGDYEHWGDWAFHDRNGICEYTKIMPHDLLFNEVKINKILGNNYNAPLHYAIYKTKGRANKSLRDVPIGNPSTKTDTLLKDGTVVVDAKSFHDIVVKLDEIHLLEAGSQITCYIKCDLSPVGINSSGYNEIEGNAEKTSNLYVYWNGSDWVYDANKTGGSNNRGYFAIAPTLYLNPTFAPQSEIDKTNERVNSIIGTDGVSIEQFEDLNINGCWDNAIAKAIEIVGKGGVVNFTPNKVYTIEDGIKPLNGQILKGNGATIKRSNETVVTTTESTTNGNVIKVSKIPSSWRVGNRILAYSGNSSSDIIVETAKIVSIGTNEITVDSRVTVPVGTTVSKSYSMIGGSQAPIPTIYKVYDMVFDGNRDNNNSSHYWHMNDCISIYGHGTEIAGCKFFNIPNECIVCHGTIISNCYADGLNGSFVHLSCPSSNLLDVENYQGTAIIGCVAKNTNKIDGSITGHSDAVIEQSWNAGRLTVVGCQFYGVGKNVCFYLTRETNRIFDAKSTDNHDEQIIVGNVFENYNKITLPGYDNWSMCGRVIVGNVFKDCGENDMTYIYKTAYKGRVVFENNCLYGNTTAIGAQQPYQVYDTELIGEITAEQLSQKYELNPVGTEVVCQKVNKAFKKVNQSGTNIIWTVRDIAFLPL